MRATAAASSGRWGVLDRALLIALVLAMIPGIPGVGIETRTSSGSDALLALYTVAGLAPIVALAASWKWPIAAGWIGVVGGLLWAALGGFDIAGLLGAPPPPGMIVVDAVFGLIGLAVAWRSWCAGAASMKASAERNQPIAIAAALFLVFGLGSAIADPILLAYVAYYRAAPVLPLIGNVFDGGTPIGMLWGLNGVLALGVVLVVVSILEVVAGVWLWRSLKRGGWLGLVLQPLNLFFAVGFGIPILYLLAPLWSILLLSGWRSLR